MSGWKKKKLTKEIIAEMHARVGLLTAGSKRLNKSQLARDLGVSKVGFWRWERAGVDDVRAGRDTLEAAFVKAFWAALNGSEMPQEATGEAEAVLVKKDDSDPAKLEGKALQEYWRTHGAAEWGSEYGVRETTIYPDGTRSGGTFFEGGRFAVERTKPGGDVGIVEDE